MSHQNAQVTPVRIKTQEKLSDDYALYTWPCAPVLGNYVYFKRDQVHGKKVLELGAGTAIPGLVAAKCGAHVTLSDREDNPQLLEYLNEASALNGVSEVVKVIGLTWGIFSPTLIQLESQDIVLASDCFYDKKYFEDVLVTVAYLIEKNSKCEFWTTYQNRNSNRTLLPLLDKWNLECKVIPIEEEWSHEIEIEGPSSSSQAMSSVQLWEIKQKNS